MESVRLPALKVGASTSSLSPRSVGLKRALPDDRSLHQLPSLSFPASSRPALQQDDVTPRRIRIKPEDFAKSPLELATEQLQASRARVAASLNRLAQTQELFAREALETTHLVDQLQRQQAALGEFLARYFDAQARQIQRVFRGFRGRRVFHQLLAVCAVLRIQRAFRASRRRRIESKRKFRLLCRKILRGLRTVKERHELEHHELLSRMNHNLLVETQWRHAMGIDDAESDLMTALYRKRYMRRRLADVLRKALTVQSVVRYWHSLVPAKHEEPLPTEIEVDDSLLVVQDEAENVDAFEENIDDTVVEPEEPANPARVVVIPKARDKPLRTSKQDSKEGLSRDELRRRQQQFARRVHDENQRREGAHLASLEKQREAAELAERERKQMLEQQRRARAQALQPELERRGLAAIKEAQAKKELALRQQEIVDKRAVDAKQRIAAQVLSSETQQLLSRKQRATKDNEATWTSPM